MEFEDIIPWIAGGVGFFLVATLALLWVVRGSLPLRAMAGNSVRAARSIRSSRPAPTGRETPIDVLDRRFAMGEMDPQEYEERRESLEKYRWTAQV